MSNVWPILRLALREAFMPPDLVRTPEPTAEMNSAESVAGFHDAGEARLLSVYEFNARAVHALAPRGAHVVDLGSGSAQFLLYLARRRPDLTITGIEFADNMIEVGREVIVRAGMSRRIRLLQGDMRAFRHMVSEKIDLITSVFSLHHLETRRDLDLCIDEIVSAVRDKPAGVWIFDHARPRRRATALEFPEIFTPDTAAAFRDDSRNSLCASWSFDELATGLRGALGGELRSERARIVPLYQIHWLAPQGDRADAVWEEPVELGPEMRREARNLRRLFRTAPG